MKPVQVIAAGGNPLKGPVQEGKEIAYVAEYVQKNIYENRYQI